MPKPAPRDTPMRLLVYAPVGRDAALTEELLSQSRIACRICGSVKEVDSLFEEHGAGAVLMTEEALDDPDFHSFVRSLERQAPWSDISVLLFGGTSPGSDATRRIIRFRDAMRNVSLLERPMRIATVLSTIRAALRSRARQYEVRDLLVALHRARGDAESANRLKDEFLATLSHELRTPLNAILGWSTMLSHGQIEPDKMPKIFEALERNAQAQAQLIGDVLDVSRIITGKIQLRLATIDAGEVMRRALDSVRPAALAKDIDLVFRLAGASLVRADADRLQQVFWNLLSNAVKFTPAGGRISVSIDHRPPSLDIIVADTGVGIDRAFLPFVFDRFRQADQSSTRAHGGLGLGLALVKHLVELQGGVVRVESEGVGRGASFGITLPAVDFDADRRGSAVDSNVQPAPEFSLSFEGRFILIVDDDAATRDLLEALLGSVGAKVTVAESSAGALRLWRNRHFDLILADLAMPGEDGLSLIRRIRASRARGNLVPAVALTAHADQKSREEAIEAGFSACLAKPARPQDLLGVINTLLGLA